MPAISPQVFPPVNKGNQILVGLQPLAGDTGQGPTPETTAWIAVRAGSVLAAQLTVTALAPSPGGAICVHVETCNHVSNGVSVDGPRFLGAFRMTPTASLPSTQPLIGSPVVDNYIRVVATPSPVTTNVAWTVSGNLIAAAYGNSV